MRKHILLWSLVIMLSVPVTAWAEGENNHGSHGGGHGDTPAPAQQLPAKQDSLQPEAPSHEMPGMTNEEHQNRQHAPSVDSHEGGHNPTTEPPAEGGHGHSGPVIETPPNWGVLGAFGAVNLLFVLIGIWNKWFARKVGV